jgi:hypothetical protein
VEGPDLPEGDWERRWPPADPPESEWVGLRDLPVDDREKVFGWGCGLSCLGQVLFALGLLLLAMIAFNGAPVPVLVVGVAVTLAYTGIFMESTVHVVTTRLGVRPRTVWAIVLVGWAGFIAVILTFALFPSEP